MNHDARYDVVLYGATGFTGSQTAEYFDDRVGNQLRWAIAGRNADKLAQLRTHLHSSPDVLVADADDNGAIDAMVAQTRVLLTTAGPFARYGEAVVRSCATRGVHYADITGETPWVRRMIDRYEQRPWPAEPRSCRSAVSIRCRPTWVRSCSSNTSEAQAKRRAACAHSSARKAA